MSFSKEEIERIFARFSSLKVMVVGDVMIDTYLHGKVERISPEAPVPVVTLRERVSHLGGAANVALNIKSLGAEVLLCSVVGNDKQGEEFAGLMAGAGMATTGIMGSSSRITTTKFRIMGNKTQMLRVDEETDACLDESDKQRFSALLNNAFTDFRPDVVVLQDYNKGVLCPGIIGECIQLALDSKVPVAVDPKKMNFSEYRGVTLFKPNLKEIAEGLKMQVDASSLPSLNAAAQVLHSTQKVEQVMITLSEHGVYISTMHNGRETGNLIPAFLRNISDVSGAGDTVIAVAALCLALKTDPALMATLANLAGGLVCEQPGVVPVDKSSLLSNALSLLCQPLA